MYLHVKVTDLFLFRCQPLAFHFFLLLRLLLLLTGFISNTFAFYRLHQIWLLSILAELETICVVCGFENPFAEIKQHTQNSATCSINYD